MLCVCVPQNLWFSQTNWNESAFVQWLYAASFGVVGQIPVPRGNLCRLLNVFQWVKSALWDQTNLSLDTDAAEKLGCWEQQRI